MPFCKAAFAKREDLLSDTCHNQFTAAIVGLTELLTTEFQRRYFENA